MLVIGADLGWLELEICNAKRRWHTMSVPDSEGSQLLPEDLGPGEPVSGLRP